MDAQLEENRKQTDLEKSLLRAIQKGDNKERQEAFRNLYYYLETGIKGTIRNTCQDLDELSVEDVSQNTWKIVVEKIGTYDDSRGVPLYHWVNKIARWEALTYQRRFFNKQIPLPENFEEYHLTRQPEPEYKAIENEQDQKLKNKIKELPPKSRAVMELRLMGYRNKEIAAILNITTKNVYQHNWWGLKRLKEIWIGFIVWLLSRGREVKAGFGELVIGKKDQLRRCKITSTFHALFAGENVELILLQVLSRNKHSDRRKRQRRVRRGKKRVNTKPNNWWWRLSLGFIMTALIFFFALIVIAGEDKPEGNARQLGRKSEPSEDILPLVSAQTPTPSRTITRTMTPTLVLTSTPELETTPIFTASPSVSPTVPLNAISTQIPTSTPIAEFAPIPTKTPVSLPTSSPAPHPPPSDSSVTPVVEFAAKETIIDLGECTSLLFYINFIEAAWLWGNEFRGLGLVGPTGSLETCPDETSSYLLRAETEDGIIERSVTILVKEEKPEPEPTSGYAATPTSVPGTLPTETPWPSATPTITVEPDDEITPEPPEVTPEPTATPQATAIPTPTAQPTPSPTPVIVTVEDLKVCAEKRASASCPFEVEVFDHNLSSGTLSITGLVHHDSGINQENESLFIYINNQEMFAAYDEPGKSDEPFGPISIHLETGDHKVLVRHADSSDNPTSAGSVAIDLEILFVSD